MSLISQQEGRGDLEGAEWVTAGYFFPISEPVHGRKKKKKLPDDIVLLSKQLYSFKCNLFFPQCSY